MPDNATRPILVVEDDSLLRLMAVDLLEDAGFRVLEAMTGERAAGMIEGGEPLLGLFTDVELGGQIDGYALARITHDRCPDTPILVVSGHRPPTGQELPEGAVFLSKPYNPAIVLRTLQTMVGRLEARD